MSRDEGPDTDEPVSLIEDGALFYRGHARDLQQQSMDCSLIVGAVWTHVWFTI
jgi:hypothetical protein